MDKDMYVYILINSLDAFLNTRKKYVEKILEDNPSIKDSIIVLDSFKQGLDKTKHILDYIEKNFSEEEIEEELVRTVLILSSETLTWLLFNLPNLYEKFPFFSEEFQINRMDILDVIGNNLLEIENLMEKPKEIIFIIKNLKQNVITISMTIGFMKLSIEKGLVDN